MRTKNSVFLKREKIKIKKAGDGRSMPEVNICLQTFIHHCLKDFLWKTQTSSLASITSHFRLQTSLLN
ncbi:hypothetical protein EGI15_10760 [Chryseobacterium cucumeris]|uniref:Uncharacterized protein n=1 Tax=Chryseobacterium cucumeris TaxID=1813611 RepID=A0ABX9X9F4_9FLAO|nr:hypothetical protein EGI15_10760 [Chryseobacterium cucumeris]